MELTWFFTVLGLMLRPAAITAFDYPVVRNAKTSFSREVRRRRLPVISFDPGATLCASVPTASHLCIATGDVVDRAHADAMTRGGTKGSCALASDCENPSTRGRAAGVAESAYDNVGRQLTL
jgi:hypothetical protein